MRPQPIPPGPGQESVWDYPRPPRLEPTTRHIRVVFNGVTVAETRRAWRVLETSHPPVYYIPPEDIRAEYLKPGAGRSYCEWKGQAGYYTLEVNGRRAENVAWYYIPPEDIRAEYLKPGAGRSYCEWKGQAGYYTLEVNGRRAENVAWYYPNPTPAFAAIRDHVAFYAAPLDGCFVDGERVTPQPGGFYGGWITSDVVGPFKGEPGTIGW